MHQGYLYIGDIRFNKCVENIVSVHQGILKKHIGNGITQDELMKYVIEMQHIIVDLAALSHQEDLLAFAKAVKLKYEAQMIVILPLKYLPGSLLPSQLVSLGIYDFIRADVTNEASVEVVEDFLHDLIVHPTPYRKAKRWEIDRTSTQVENYTEYNQEVQDQVRQTSIIQAVNSQNDKTDMRECLHIESVANTEHLEIGEGKHRILYTEGDKAHKIRLNPKKVYQSITEWMTQKTLSNTYMQRKMYNYTIAITSAHYGAGCTMLALKLAYELASQAKVALVELDSNKALGAFDRQYDLKRGKLKSKKLAQLDVYFYDTNTLIDILTERYTYIILDLGVLRHCKDQDEAYRADQTILATQMSEWKQDELKRTLKEAKTLNRWTIACNLSNEKQYKKLKKVAHQSKEDVQVVQIPYIEDVFDEKDRQLSKLFGVEKWGG